MGQCANCPLVNPPCASGVGNEHAKIAIVGRNPGRTEAVTGVPFTGASGELLDMTLAQVGLERNDLWITNAVSCFVESDAGPTSEMYDLCRPRLYEELAIVGPEIILTLGNEATQTFLGKKAGGIMSLVGTMHPFGSAWIIPSFHPAYILRGSFEGYQDLSEAIERAKALIDGERPLPQPLPFEHVHYLTDDKAIVDKLWELNQSSIASFGIDTETDSVRDPTRRILLLQLSDGVDAWVFECEGTSITLKGSQAWCLLRDLLLDEERTFIFHNAAFDLQQLLAHWEVIPPNIEDTMALALCLNESLRYAGLKKLVNAYLSVPHYEEGIHKYLTHKNVGFSAIPRAELVPYAGFDAIFTWQLYPVLKARVEEEGNYKLAPFLTEVQRLFAKMAFRGAKVDLDYVEELRSEYEPLRDRLETEMQAYAWGKGFRATEVVANAKDWPFLNVRSPKQLLYFMNNYCGLETDTTDKKFMELNEGNEFIDMLGRFRTIDHLISAFVDGIAEEVWPDGKVHPDFMHGTVTGRTTIQHPALQTILRDDFAEQYHVKSIRRLFVPEKGNMLIHADYSQLEIRVAWHISGDEALGAAVMSKDMHRTMAAAVYQTTPELVTGYQRSMSKLVTFGMMYGRQAPSIAKQMKVSVEEAQKLLDAYEAQFPKYFAWWRQQRVAALESGVLETEFGRRRRWRIITPEIEREIQNQASNFKIQSTASDICMNSLIKIEKELEQREWGRALFSVHDSVELEVREDVVQKAVELAMDIMIHPFEHSCATFHVKYGYGYDWSEASHERD